VHPVSDLQIEYSLFSRGIEDGILSTCRELGIGITANGVLSRGLISGHWTSDRTGRDFRNMSPRFQGANLDANLALVERLRGIAAHLGGSVAPCVSTGGRILGLGDIGANGMGIPIGKLQLYTARAAVPPSCLLPVLLDVGTTNAALRADPLYLGVRGQPPSEKELDELVEEFVQAVQQVFPGCCIHFEDWKGTDAIRLLSRYRDKVLCYNDDIQGTAKHCTTCRRLAHDVGVVERDNRRRLDRLDYHFSD
jgi:hypothetical protein